MDAAYLRQRAADFGYRYLHRYRALVQEHGHQPLTASALWVPAAPKAFLGVSWWLAERTLNDAVSAALGEIEFTLPFHGQCAEPVSITKALRELGDTGKLAGGRCVAIRLDLTNTSLKPGDTFRPRGTFGHIKAACEVCSKLLEGFGIEHIDR